MAIKPILFNTEMVRAILDGRKTCTRRLLKGPFTVHPNGYITKPRGNENLCPYEPPYQPGDILYVRETWERFECCNCEGDERGFCPKEPQKNVLDKHSCGCYMYRATDEIRGDAKWHPSIHMPKEAARIWLKVTDVRVERLQEITVDDCHREGINIETSAVTDGETLNRNHDFSLEKFESLWDLTVKKSDLDRYGWGANPWVWVIEFERCKKPEEGERWEG